MAEEEDKQEQEKFDFDPRGESPGYISLDQARVMAIQHARDNTEFYGPRYRGMNFVWEVQSQEETEDFYEIRLSFRPSGRYRGSPGIEQFTINKVNGAVEIRQILDEPDSEDLPPVPDADVSADERGEAPGSEPVDTREPASEQTVSATTADVEESLPVETEVQSTTEPGPEPATPEPAQVAEPPPPRLQTQTRGRKLRLGPIGWAAVGAVVVVIVGLLASGTIPPGSGSDSTATPVFLPADTAVPAGRAAPTERPAPAVTSAPAPTSASTGASEPTTAVGGTQVPLATAAPAVGSVGRAQPVGALNIGLRQTGAFEGHPALPPTQA